MTTLTMHKLPYVTSPLGEENPLPDLKSAGDVHAAIAIDRSTVSEEEARYMGWGRVHTILPYTKQDGYVRSPRTEYLDTAVLENTHIRATFLPTLGGRLWSLFDKDAGKELLHVNPVIQPCNLALRNAWFSGGVEWNCGIIGHTPFTMDRLTTQELHFADGTPLLRMFQYERVRHLLYRVEAFLPENAREVMVRVRIDNTLQEDTAVYWWSNMAVNEAEDVRVIVPASKAFRYGYGGNLSKVDIPYMTVDADKLAGRAREMARESGGTLDWDISRTTTLPQAMDFFFDVPKDTRPFISALNRDGYGMCQTSTGELRGRKLFVWGMSKGGRHWQEFLSRKGSAYLELQSGLAHTQLEHLPMKAGASLSWLESYGPLQADPAIIHAQDYQAAARHALDELNRQRPADTLEAWHERVRQEIDIQSVSDPSSILSPAVSFAPVEAAMRGQAFSACGLPINLMDQDQSTAPWMELAEKGTFPCPDPMLPPRSYMLGSVWKEALEKAIANGSNHWYSQYQLAVMHHAENEREQARECYERSLTAAANPWALRGLALLDETEGQLQSACALYMQAVQLSPVRPLVIEALACLLAAKEYEDMLSLVDSLSDELRENGRIRILYAAALLRSGRLDAANEILHSDLVVPDVREGDELLSDLFFESAALRQYGRCDDESLAWARKNTVVPEHLDFRMK